MSVTIQLRRDTAANWTSVNPTLANGEAGWETDTGKVKIGNGATAWASLAYVTTLGAVSSVFGRTGAVVAVTGDYGGVVSAFLTGATQASRYVGATTSGAPVSGTFAVGDFVIARDAHIFVCTVAGSPGTWVDVGGSVSYATPAVVLGSSAAAGAASTVIRSDSTIAAFDATSPSTQAFGDSAVVGTAAFAARRDHKHAMPAAPSATVGDGWVDDTAETWTYASADGPTFTFTITGDFTAKYTPGKRLKLTQTTVKYFIVTAVAVSSGTTTVTIYGGTDYTLANAAISANFHSFAKAPDGFPLDPAKWMESFSDTSVRTQGSPSANTWYNPGTLKLDVPIGCWDLSWWGHANSTRTTAGSVAMFGTLSTANNTASNPSLTEGHDINTQTQIQVSLSRHAFVTVAAKTTYYLNAMTDLASSTGVGWFGSSVHPTLITAVCAYL